MHYAHHINVMLTKGLGEPSGMVLLASEFNSVLKTVEMKLLETESFAPGTWETMESLWEAPGRQAFIATRVYLTIWSRPCSSSCIQREPGFLCVQSGG